MTTVETLETRTDENAVRDLLARLAAAWADQDPDAFAELYADDATVVTTLSYQKGKEEIRAFMTAGFADRLMGTTTTEEPDRIRFVGDDVAIVNSLSGVVLPGESAARPDLVRRSTWVMARTGGKWLVESYHNCTLGQG